jgi:hypothetical protein
MKHVTSAKIANYVVTGLLVLQLKWAGVHISWVNKFGFSRARGGDPFRPFGNIVFQMSRPRLAT